MTERLDRIEARLETTGQRLNQPAQRHTKRAKDIDMLLSVIATTEAFVDQVTGRTGENELLVKTMRAEANADRLETKRLWNDAVAQMNINRAKAKTRADAEHAKNANRFDVRQKVIQRLLVELEMNRDNQKLRDRVDRIDGLEQTS